MKKTRIKKILLFLLIKTLLILSTNSCNNKNLSTDTSDANYTEGRTYSRHIIEPLDTRWWYYFWEGDYWSSLKKLNLTLQLVELQGRHQIAEFYNRMGALHNDLGNDKQADFYFSRALEIVQVDNGTLARLRALKSFVTLYASGGSMEQFEGVMDIGTSVRDSLMLKQHGIKKKVELLTQKTENTLRKQTTILLLITIIGLIIALAVFAILFYRNREQLKQENTTNLSHYKKLSELNEEIAELKKQIQDKDTEKPNTSEKLAFELQQLFKNEKIYRRQGLSVDDVVSRLNTNSKYLSNVVSQHYGQNFTRYVNTYRLQEAIEILTQQQSKDSKYANYTIQAVAEEVGFSGKSSFYLAFKQIIGVAPLEYIKTMTAGAKSLTTEIEFTKKRSR